MAYDEDNDDRDPGPDRDDWDDDEDDEDDEDEDEPDAPGWDYDDDRSMFADPGGRSALRAESRSNPRNLPCPHCGRPNRLTPKDRACGYQCDSCADAAERGSDY